MLFHGSYLMYVLYRAPSEYHIERVLGVGCAAIILSLQAAVLFGGEAALVADLTEHRGTGELYEDCFVFGTVVTEGQCTQRSGCKWMSHDVSATPRCERDITLSNASLSTFRSVAAFASLNFVMLLAIQALLASSKYEMISRQKESVGGQTAAQAGSAAGLYRDL